MKIPTSEKCVDEVIGVWSELGIAEDGTLNINDGTCDVFQDIPTDIALKVVAAHDEFRQKLYDLLCHPAPKPTPKLRGYTSCIVQYDDLGFFSTDNEV